ncbi:hypothetical protein AB6E89_01270 [Vibrio breoganii]
MTQSRNPNVANSLRQLATLANIANTLQTLSVKPQNSQPTSTKQAIKDSASQIFDIAGSVMEELECLHTTHEEQTIQIISLSKELKATKERLSIVEMQSARMAEMRHDFSR